MNPGPGQMSHQSSPSVPLRPPPPPSVELPVPLILPGLPMSGFSPTPPGTLGQYAALGAVLAPPSTAGRQAEGYSRKAKSLSLLCENFITQFGQVDAVISLDGSAKILGVERRRIYDIVNVLEAVKVVSKIQKNQYSWHGMDRLSTSLAELRAEAEAELAHVGGSATAGGGVGGLPLLPAGGEAGVEDASAAALDERKEKSMTRLSQRFVQMFMLSKSRSLGLEEAARALLGGAEDAGQFKTKVRRLYDIANILSALHLIEKTHVGDKGKPGFRWLGPDAVLAAVSRAAAAAARGSHHAQALAQAQAMGLDAIARAAAAGQAAAPFALAQADVGLGLAQGLPFSPAAAAAAAYYGVGLGFGPPAAHQGMPGSGHHLPLQQLVPPGFAPPPSAASSSPRRERPASPEEERPAAKRAREEGEERVDGDEGVRGEGVVGGEGIGDLASAHPSAPGRASTAVVSSPAQPVPAPGHHHDPAAVQEQLAALAAAHAAAQQHAQQLLQMGFALGGVSVPGAGEADALEGVPHQVLEAASASAQPPPNLGAPGEARAPGPAVLELEGSDAQASAQAPGLRVHPLQKFVEMEAEQAGEAGLLGAGKAPAGEGVPGAWGWEVSPWVSPLAAQMYWQYAQAGAGAGPGSGPGPGALDAAQAATLLGAAAGRAGHPAADAQLQAWYAYYGAPPPGAPALYPAPQPSRAAMHGALGPPSRNPSR